METRGRKRTRVDKNRSGDGRVQIRVAGIEEVCATRRAREWEGSGPGVAAGARRDGENPSASAPHST
jgi:hypothetical protein